MDRKQFEVKTESDGTVEAVIATLDVKDKDGDVTKQGFFGEQTVSIVLAHDWGPVMLGKGTISDADGKAAILKGQLNLDDPEAKALHSRLMFDMKNPPPIIEWSYGFDILEGGAKAGQHNGENVRILQPRPDGTPGGKVFEASPVMVGAGEGTGTLAVKTTPNWVTPSFSHSSDTNYEIGDQGPEVFIPRQRLKFADQIDQTTIAVRLVGERAAEIRDLRKTGQLGEDARERISLLTGELEAATELLHGLVGEAPEPPPDDPDPKGSEMMAELMRFEALRARMLGANT